MQEIDRGRYPIQLNNSDVWMADIMRLVRNQTTARLEASAPASSRQTPVGLHLAPDLSADATTSQPRPSLLSWRCTPVAERSGFITECSCRPSRDKAAAVLAASRQCQTAPPRPHFTLHHRRPDRLLVYVGAEENVRSVMVRVVQCLGTGSLTGATSAGLQNALIRHFEADHLKG